MINIPIDLGDVILYVDWEEFNKRREYYNKMQIEAIGRITTANIPQQYGYSVYGKELKY